MKEWGVRSKEWRVVIAVLIVLVVFATFAVGQTENSSKKFDIPVKIISKPRAVYPSQKNGTICVQGTVTLRVQFLENDEIGKIAVVSGLPHGLNESATEAAKKIKFKAAMKGGKSVTIFKTVQYNFTLY